MAGADGTPQFTLGQYSTPTANFGNSVLLFCPTARGLDSDGVQKDEISARTQTSIYARGVKEKIPVTVTGASPWKWRRIGFSIKDLHNRISGINGTAVGYNTGIGNFRPNINLSGTTAETQLLTLIFAGTAGLDWTDSFHAKLDTSRITVHMDRFITLNPGNQAGRYKVYKFWHPLNKNIVYDDDERGTDMTTIPFSVSSKPGMGDYYILDLFQRAVQGVATDIMTINPETTFYWHER